MTARERKLSALLAETLDFWKRIESGKDCDRGCHCNGPSISLEGKHEKEWRKLCKRAERELAALPN